MADDLATLVVRVQADLSALKAELVSLRGATVAELGVTNKLIGDLFTQMSQRAARGVAAATKTMSRSYEDMVAYSNSLGQKFEAQNAALQARTLSTTQNSINQANQLGIKQQGIFEAQKLKEQQLIGRSLQKEKEAIQEKVEYARELGIKQQGIFEAQKLKEQQLAEKVQNKMTKGAEDHHKTLERLRRTALAFLGMWALREALSGINRFVTVGVEFNKTIETATLGIASIIAAQGEFIDQTGRMAQGYEKLVAAQKVSREVINQLKIDNLQTIATLDQLIKAFQQGLAPAMAAGFNIEQARQYTVAMVQAAGAIGMNLDMLAEEMRSLITGAITPRTSLIATALGITPSDIRKLQGDTEGHFNWIMKRLEAFRIAGIASQKTFSGLWSNLKDVFSVAMGEASAPFFEYLKKVMTDLVNSIVKVNIVTKEMEFNEDFLDKARTFYNIIQNLIEALMAVKKAFTPIFDIILKISDVLMELDKLSESVGLDKLLDKLLDKRNEIFGVDLILEGLKAVEKKIKDITIYWDQLKGGPEYWYRTHSEAQLREMERAKRAYEFVAKKRTMPENLRKEKAAEMDAVFAEIKNGIDAELTAYKQATDVKVALAEREMAKVLLIEEDYQKLRKDIINNQLESEIFALERLRDATAKTFEEKAGYLLKNKEWAVSEEGLFDNRKQLTDAERKMLTEIAKLNMDIFQKKSQQQIDEINLETELIKLYRKRLETQISLLQGLSQEEYSYAKSTDDIEKMNEELQTQVGLKNKSLDIEYEMFLKVFPQYKEQIDRQKELNQLTTDQIKLLNQLDRTKAFAGANKELAQLLYLYEDIKAAEQTLLDEEIMRYQITSSKNQELLAVYERIYELKSAELYRPTELPSLAAASAFLFDITGSQEYLDKYVDFNNKILAEEKKKNSALIGSESELHMIMLEKATRFYNDYLGLQESFLNKQINAYKKLYQHTLYQQYLDKITETQNRMLDIYDEKNKQLGLNERDVHRLRMIQMADNQKEMLDLIQQGANREIDIQANKANSIEQYEKGFNVPIPGTNISSMTGQRLGYGGTILTGRATGGRPMWFPSSEAATRFAEEYNKNINLTQIYEGLIKLTGPAAGGGEKWFTSYQDVNKFVKDWKDGLGQATTSVSNLSSAVDTLTSKFQAAYQSFQSFLTERERREWTISDWEKQFNKLAKSFQELNPSQVDYFDQSMSLLDEMLDTLKHMDSLEQKALQEQKNLINTLQSTFNSLGKTILELEFGPQAPTQSVEAITGKYAELYSRAITADTEDISKAVDEFLDFLPIYLDFMKGFGTDYNVIIADVLKNLKELRGLTGLEMIFPGFDAREIFKLDYEQRIPAQLALIVDLLYDNKLEGQLGSVVTLLTDVAKVPGQLGDVINLLTDTSVDGQLGDVINLLTAAKVSGELASVVDLLTAAKVSGQLGDVVNLLTTTKHNSELAGVINLLTTAKRNGELADIVNLLATAKKDGQLAYVINLLTTTKQDGQLASVINLLTTIKQDGQLASVINLLTAAKVSGQLGDVVNLLTTTKQDGQLASVINLLTAAKVSGELASVVNLLTLDKTPAQLKSIIDLDITTKFPTVTKLIDLLNIDWDAIKDEDKAKITGLIALLSGANSLPEAASNTVGNVDGLITTLDNTKNPLDTVGTNLDIAVQNIKQAVETIESFFTILGERIGVSFTGTAASTVSIPTKIETVPAATYPANVIYSWTGGIYDPSAGYGAGAKQYKAIVVGKSGILELGYGPFGFAGYTYRMPAAKGGLTKGFTLAGEIGPEWVVPTYEPERSSFLKSAPSAFWENLNPGGMMVTKSSNIPSLNIDAEAIGDSIAKKLAPILINQEGKEIHIHVEVDRKEIANAIIKEGKGNSELIETIRKIVMVK